MDELQRALERAARDTLARIEEDLAGVPAKWRPALAEIRDRLFDADRSAVDFAAGRRQLSTALVDAVGESLTAYVARARLETALRLLRDTDLAIADVSLLVGYADTVSFRHALQRRFGLGPQAFRARAQRITATVGWPEDEVLSLLLWRRIRRGEIRGRRLQRLRHWFCKLFAESETGTAGAGAEDFWSRLAVKLGSAAAALPPAERRRALRGELRSPSPPFAELLRRLGGEGPEPVESPPKPTGPGGTP